MWRFGRTPKSDGGRARRRSNATPVSEVLTPRVDGGEVAGRCDGARRQAYAANIIRNMHCNKAARPFLPPLWDAILIAASCNAVVLMGASSAGAAGVVRPERPQRRPPFVRTRANSRLGGQLNSRGRINTTTLMGRLCSTMMHRTWRSWPRKHPRESNLHLWNGRTSRRRLTPTTPIRPSRISCSRRQTRRIESKIGWSMTRAVATRTATARRYSTALRRRPTRRLTPEDFICPGFGSERGLCCSSLSGLLLGRAGPQKRMCRRQA